MGVARLRQAFWLPVTVALVGVLAVIAHGGPPKTTLAVGAAAPTSTTSHSLPTSTTTTEPVPLTTVPEITATSLPQPTACPCDAVTGEPLGGAVIEKGVDGTVTDADGAPLAGVCVTVDKPMVGIAVTTTSGTDGTFAVDLGTSNDTPLFMLDAYACDGATAPFTPIRLNGDQLDPNSYNHVHIVLQRSATIVGTAVDEHDAPMTGSCVTVSGGDQSISEVVGPDGSYRVIGIAAGDVQARVGPDCGGAPYPDDAAINNTRVSPGQTLMLPPLRGLRAGGG